MAKLSKSDKWTGMRNGMLVAIENRGPVLSVTGRPSSVWLFKCDCGNEKLMCPNDVFKKRKNPNFKGISSCGCNTRSIQSSLKRKPDGEAALNSLYNSYTNDCAKNRGYEFKLTLLEFKEITSCNCFYCGKEPNQFKRSKLSYYKYNGIDRVDNTKGYIRSNVVAACKECNSLKSGITIEIAKKMLTFLGLYND